MRPIRSLNRLLLGAALAARAAFAQSDDASGDLNISALPSNDDFLRRTSGTLMVLGDYAYYDGGEMSQLVDGENLKDVSSRSSNGPNSTLSFDLTTSWTLEDAKITALDKNSPNMMRQSAFKRGDKSFYIWGGHTSYGASLPKPELWRFNADGSGDGQWSPETPQNPDFFEDMERSEGGAYVTTNDSAFHFGGKSSAGTSPDGRGYQPGYLQYNYTTGRWSNQTDAPWSAYGTMYVGSAEYIPNFGPNGIVMLLGGVTRALDGSSEGFLEFGNLTFMDPVTRQWYSQTTTGSEPSRRSRHCSVGIAGPDGTWNIYLYAGRNDRDKSIYNDLHILTLPAFHWIKTHVTDNEDGRIGHACGVVGKRQMLSVGGINSEHGQPGWWEDKDHRPQGVGVMDMTELKWKDGYDANADDYRHPKVVEDFYSDEYTETDWESEGVESLFSQRPVGDSLEAGDGDNEGGFEGGDGGGGGNDDDDDSSGSDGPNVGAIVGGVVAGLCCLAIGGVLIWFFIIRGRKQPDNKAQELHAESGYLDPHGHDAAGFKSMASTPQELHCETYKAEMADSSPKPELAGREPPPKEGVAAELDGTPTTAGGSQHARPYGPPSSGVTGSNFGSQGVSTLGSNSNSPYSGYTHETR